MGEAFKTISEKFEMGLYLDKKALYVGGSWRMHVDVDIDITDVETDIIKHDIDKFDHSVVFPDTIKNPEKLSQLFRRYSVVSFEDEKIETIDQVLAAVCLPIINNPAVKRCQIVTDDLEYNYTFTKTSYRKGCRYEGIKIQISEDE